MEARSKDIDFVRLVETGSATFGEPQKSDGQSNLTLLQHSNRFGLTFVGNEEGVLVVRYGELQQECWRHKMEEGRRKALPAVRSLPTNSAPIGLALSSDEMTLAVALREKVLLFDLPSVLHRKVQKPFGHSGQPGSISSMEWSYGESLQEQKLLVLSVLANRESCLRLYNSSMTLLKEEKEGDYVSACWSPDGQQLLVGTNTGKVLVLDGLNLEVQQEIDSPSEVDFDAQAHYVSWVEPELMTVGYKVASEEEEEEQPILCIIEGGRFFVFPEVPAVFPVEGRRHFYQVSYLREWRTFFVGCTISADLAIIVFDEEDAAWLVWNLAEKYQPRLPMDKDDEETFPVGFALSLNSSLPIPGDDPDDDPWPPAPVLLCATTDGVLLPYAYLDMSISSEIPFLSPPEALGESSGRELEEQDYDNGEEGEEEEGGAKEEEDGQQEAAESHEEREDSEEEERRSDEENVFASGAESDEDSDLERAEAAEEAAAAFTQIDKEESGKIASSLFPSLYEALGSTYCEETHSKIIPRLSKNGYIAKQDFIDWYVHFLLDEEEESDEEEEERREVDEEEAKKPLSELFKVDSDSWKCPVCMVPNKKDANKCVACESPNPNAKDDTQKKGGGFAGKSIDFGGSQASSSSSSTTPQFSFGIASGQPISFSFGNGSSSTAPSSSFTPSTSTSFGFTFNSAATSSQGVGGGFSFGPTSTPLTTPLKVSNAEEEEDRTVKVEGKEDDGEEERRSDEENEFASGAESEGDSEAEKEEAKEEAVAAFETIDKDGEGEVPSSLFPSLFEALGSTYCEETHSRIIPKISDDGKIYKERFVNWYVDFLFSEEDEESDDETDEDALRHTKTEETKPLSELFKVDSDSWKCSVCMVQNKKEAKQCVACESPNPDAKSSAQQEGGGLFSKPFDLGKKGQTSGFTFGLSGEGATLSSAPSSAATAGAPFASFSFTGQAPTFGQGGGGGFSFNPSQSSGGGGFSFTPSQPSSGGGGFKFGPTHEQGAAVGGFTFKPSQPSEGEKLDKKTESKRGEVQSTKAEEKPQKEAETSKISSSAYPPDMSKKPPPKVPATLGVKAGGSAYPPDLSSKPAPSPFSFKPQPSPPRGGSSSAYPPDMSKAPPPKVPASFGAKPSSSAYPPDMSKAPPPKVPASLGAKATASSSAYPPDMSKAPPPKVPASLGAKAPSSTSAYPPDMSKAPPPKVPASLGAKAPSSSFAYPPDMSKAPPPAPLHFGGEAKTSTSASAPAKSKEAPQPPFNFGGSALSSGATAPSWSFSPTPTPTGSSSPYPPDLSKKAPPMAFSFGSQKEETTTAKTSVSSSAYPPDMSKAPPPPPPSQLTAKPKATTSLYPPDMSKTAAPPAPFSFSSTASSSSSYPPDLSKHPAPKVPAGLNGKGKEASTGSTPASSAFSSFSNKASSGAAPSLSFGGIEKEGSGFNFSAFQPALGAVGQLGGEKPEQKKTEQEATVSKASAAKIISTTAKADATGSGKVESPLSELLPQLPRSSEPPKVSFAKGKASNEMESQIWALITDFHKDIVKIRHQAESQPTRDSSYVSQIEKALEGVSTQLDNVALSVRRLELSNDEQEQAVQNMFGFQEEVSVQLQHASSLLQSQEDESLRYLMDNIPLDQSSQKMQEQLQTKVDIVEGSVTQLQEHLGRMKLERRQQAASFSSITNQAQLSRVLIETFKTAQMIHNRVAALEQEAEICMRQAEKLQRSTPSSSAIKGSPALNGSRRSSLMSDALDGDRAAELNRAQQRKEALRLSLLRSQGGDGRTIQPTSHSGTPSLVKSTAASARKKGKEGEREMRSQLTPHQRLPLSAPQDAGPGSFYQSPQTPVTEKQRERERLFGKKLFTVPTPQLQLKSTTVQSPSASPTSVRESPLVKERRSREASSSVTAKAPTMPSFSAPERAMGSFAPPPTAQMPSFAFSIGKTPTRPSRKHSTDSSSTSPHLRGSSPASLPITSSTPPTTFNFKPLDREDEDEEEELHRKSTKSRARTSPGMQGLASSPSPSPTLSFLSTKSPVLAGKTEDGGKGSAAAAPAAAQSTSGTLAAPKAAGYPPDMSKRKPPKLPTGFGIATSSATPSSSASSSTSTAIGGEGPKPKSSAYPPDMSKKEAPQLPKSFGIATTSSQKSEKETKRETPKETTSSSAFSFAPSSSVTTTTKEKEDVKAKNGLDFGSLSFGGAPKDSTSFGAKGLTDKSPFSTTPLSFTSTAPSSAATTASSIFGGSTSTTTPAVSSFSLKSSSSTPTPSASLSLKDKILRIYQQYNPQKLGDVDSLASKYAGKDAEVVKKLQTKYKIPDEKLKELIGEAAGPVAATPTTPFGASASSSASSSPFGTSSSPFGSTAASPFGPTAGQATSTTGFGTTSSFGSSPSPFGSTGNTTAPAFGQTTASLSSSSSPFGQTTSGTSAFGQSSATPGFGGTTTQPVFGSTSAFGQGSAPSVSPFGQAAVSKPSGFGQSTSSTPAFGQTTPFGAQPSATPAFGQTSPFGAASQSTAASPFGGGFGQTSGFGSNTNYRQRLLDFYQKHNPSKVHEVDNLLAKYKGREEQMFATLEKKYAQGSTAMQGGGGGAAPTVSPFSSFGSSTPQPAFGQTASFGQTSGFGASQPAFGGPSPLGGGTTGTGFGATSPLGGGFGSGAGSGFGSTSPSPFSTSAAPPASGFSTFASKPVSFGTVAGQGTGGFGGFGASPGGSSGFGASGGGFGASAGGFGAPSNPSFTQMRG